MFSTRRTGCLFAIDDTCKHTKQMSSSRAVGEALAPTERQLVVLRAYVRAGTHQSAAKLLGLSTRTVQAHLSALRSRLGVHNEAQAVYALWLGYRDHLPLCTAASHETCMPPFAAARVSQEPVEESPRPVR